MSKTTNPKNSGGIHTPRDGRSSSPDKFGTPPNGSSRLGTKSKEDGKTIQPDKSGINLAASGSLNGAIQSTIHGRSGAIPDAILTSFLHHSQDVLHTRDVEPCS